MATLTTKVIEEITLNNNSYNSERSLDISSVNEIVKRIVTISTTETGLLGFATASSTDLSKSYLAGQFDEDDVRYIRITNLDSTNHLTLTFRDEDSTEFCMKVDAGHSFIYPGDNSGGVKDTMHAAGSAITVSLNDLVDITALADTDSCDVEVFVGERLMASSYTGLGTELMTTGENAGTWGSTTNTNLQIIEQISGGYIEQDVAGSADTTALSVSDGSTGAVLGHRIIKFTGTMTGNQIVTIPLDVQQLYVLVNGTSGAYTVQFKYASGSGSSVTFAATDKGSKLVYATADHATNPNLVDSGIASTGDHDLDGNELILDADADTSITADTDDQIDIKIAGADDFQFTANTFTAQAGSTIAAQALTATTVTASGIVKTDDTTEATTTTDGSLQTDGGLSIAKDAVFGDDVKLLSDSAVLSFGADSDTTLTHTDGTGLTLNSTNKLLFRDTGLYINSSTDGQLDLVADTEIQIAATTIDINGAIAMDGAITGATNITLSGELDAATLDISGNADIDGTTNLDAVDIDGAVQIDGAVTVGVDGTGLDVKFFGDTAGSFLLWDQSADALLLTDSTPIQIGDAQDLTLYHDGTNSYITNAVGALKVATETSGIAVTIGHTTSEVTIADNLTVTGTLTLGSGAELTEAELEFLDGITAGTAAASKAMVADGNIDITGGRNITISGELDAATLDISGNADIDGTTNLDAVDIDGAVQIDGAVTTGVDDTGVDVKFFGATSGSFLLWDESDDALELTDSSPIKIGDGGDMQIYHDGSNSYLTNSQGALKIATETSGIAITLGHGTSEVTVADNLTVTGDLTINGTTTTVNSTTLTVDDPTITLGGDSAPGSDDNKDRGVEFRYHDGSNAQIGFMGYDDSATGFIFLTAASNSSEVFSGTEAKLIAGSLDISGDADIDGTLETDALSINGTTVSSTAAELNLVDGITAGTISASLAVIVDSNKDISGFRNVTLTGELDAATLDISGNADIDGTTNLDAVDIDGAVQLDATLTIGANDQGYDVILYGDTASANVTWDTSADDLIFNGGAGLIVPDGQFTLGSTAVSSTASELNLLDGGTSVGGSITLADGDGVVTNDGGTMKTIPASDIKTYVGSAAGAFSIANLDIDGATDIGEAIVDADLFIVDNGAGGTNRKVAASRIVTYIDANSSAASTGKAIAMALVFG